MRTSLPTQHHHLRSRRLFRQKQSGAFTIIELLVAIGIILFLVSLTFVGATNALGLSKAASTRATILKVDNALRIKFDSVIKRAEKIEKNRLERMRLVAEANSKAAIAFSFSPNTTLGSLFNDDATRSVIITMHLMRKTVPQSFHPYEVGPTNPITTSAGSNYQSANHKERTESAAILYHLLVGSTGENTDSESPTFSSAEIKDTDGDGLLEIVDGWGEPLRFYRWPTRALRPTRPSIANIFDPTDISLHPEFARVIYGNLRDLKTLNSSPLDPTSGLLQWTTSVTSVSDQNNRLQAIEALFATPQTFSQFVVMSAGNDKTLGFKEPFEGYSLAPSDTAPLGYLCSPDCDVNIPASKASALDAAQDNLTNYNIRR